MQGKKINAVAMDDVLEFLARLRLEQYAGAFEAQGYDDMEDVLAMTPD